MNYHQAVTAFISQFLTFGLRPVIGVDLRLSAARNWIFSIPLEN
jgi:hypothetical protein